MNKDKIDDETTDIKEYESIKRELSIVINATITIIIAWFFSTDFTTKIIGDRVISIGVINFFTANSIFLTIIITIIFTKLINPHVISFILKCLHHKK